MKIKKITYLRKKVLEIVLFITSFISIYTILIIGLQIPFLIPSPFNSIITSNLNNIMINLSYSYIAGVFFYLLTVYLPINKRKKEAIPGMKIIIDEIDRIVFEIFMEFSREQKYDIKSIYTDPCLCKNILTSKNWNDSSPFLLDTYKVKITYLKYLHSKHKEIVIAIDKLMMYYKEFLTGDQLSLCEKIRGSMLISQLDFCVNVPLIQMAEDGKEYYTNLIIKELKQIDELKQAIHS